MKTGPMWKHKGPHAIEIQNSSRQRIDPTASAARRVIQAAASTVVRERIEIMNVVDAIGDEQLKSDVPDFRTGDTVRIQVTVREGEKERIQLYQGVVIQRSGGGIAETFTVRKISQGIGVERVFPLHSPSVGGIEVVRRGKVRRSRIFYIRGLKGKAARIAERRG